MMMMMISVVGKKKGKKRTKDREEEPPIERTTKKRQRNEDGLDKWKTQLNFGVVYLSDSVAGCHHQLVLYSTVTRIKEPSKFTRS